MSRVTCNDCGACCATQCSPPFMPARFEPGGELDSLPPSIRADYEEKMVKRDANGWPDDVPCFWLTSEFRCLHYTHRPEICRGLQVGSEGCQSWRDEFNIDVEAIR
jgi:Fe-S-cluster containining protein